MPPERGISASERRPTDIELRHAFVVLGGGPFYIGPDVTGDVSHCHFVTECGYVPAFWRRSRLRRARPFVNDVLTTRRLWKWLRD